MAVYVDPVMNHGWALGPSCHMWADTEPELHNMAARLGLKRAWHQLNAKRKNCKPFSHYDLTVGKHAQALKAGVVQLDRDAAVSKWEELGYISRDRKLTHASSKTHPPVHGFQREFRFLSNFYPCEVRRGGSVFPSAEHLYQAAKTHRPEEWDLIQKAPTAAEAKRLGRHISIRPDWERTKIQAMYWILKDKFSREPLKSKLLATGDALLEETNGWGDTFWGVCNGKGKNHLGKLLMGVRYEMRKEEARVPKVQPAEQMPVLRKNPLSQSPATQTTAAFLDFRCIKCGTRFGGTTFSVPPCPKCGRKISKKDLNDIQDFVSYLAKKTDIPKTTFCTKKPVPSGISQVKVRVSGRLRRNAS